MPTMDELRRRSTEVFTELLSPSGRADASAGSEPTGTGFSWFDPEDASRAALLAFGMGVQIAGAEVETDGLATALDTAEQLSAELPAELVRQALALLTTHNRPARNLARPRALRVAPQRFVPAPPDDEGRRTGATGGEADLDYWRQDPFANEHHSHWHVVYPFIGLLPTDFLAWVGAADRTLLARLLTAFDPAGRDFTNLVTTGTPQQILTTFAQLVNPLFQNGTFFAVASQLSADLYRLLFRLNDRQGELFFYMHSQMLARYEAERSSNGMQRTAVYGPSEFASPIVEGYTSTDPTYSSRPPGLTMNAQRAARLQTAQKALEDAVDAGALDGRSGAPVPIDRTNLGEATEASAAQLVESDTTVYGSMHNSGHGALAVLPPPANPNAPTGVMNDPAVAIRDPVFWRWHRNIDDISVRWQNGRDPYDFADAPPVLVRDAGAGAAVRSWSSPDLLLVDTGRLPAGADGAALAEAALGGDAFDTAFPAGEVGDGGMVLVDELTTRFLTSDFGVGGTVTHLTHDPFALVVRIANTSDAEVRATLRVFLAPADLSEDRTSWIELDKLPVTLPAGARRVVYRPDTDFSVVKKPAETDPQSVLDSDAGEEDPNYCDCGWPYTLLLPRGAEEGSGYRLVVACTDTSLDEVGPPGECGSLSYCGAQNGYPDKLDMGFPFSRPFDGSIEDTVLATPSLAGRSLTIRHLP